MTAGTEARAAGTPRRPAPASVFTELSREVQAQGLHGRRYAWYWCHLVATVGAFLAVWVCVPLLGDSWFQLVLAAVLAVVTAQLGFLGHDAAHQQIFASKAWNEWTARVLSGAFAGLSYGWWVSKHNRHHSGPNQLDRDPDIGPGALAMTLDASAARSGLAARLTRRQGWWFFPLLTLEGLNLHVESVRTVARRGPFKRRGVEAAFLLARLAGCAAVLLLLLPPGKAFAFLGVELALFGVLLGGAFAPNHIGMPVVPAGARVDFLRRQVLMSRNITGGRGIAFLMGGLDLQIEHHLFPSMARPNLRRVQGLVRAHCREHGVAYTETTLLEAYGAVARYLNMVGLRGQDPFRCPLLSLYRV